MALFDWPKCLNFQDDTYQQSIGSFMSLLTRIDVWLYTRRCVAYVIAYTRQCVIGFCMLFMLFFNDTWQISIGL